jgi:hypothetical protein
VAIEGQMLFAKPKLETAITDDVESAPDVTLSESLTEMFFGGGVRIRLDNLRPPNRVRPFITAGAGLQSRPMTAALRPKTARSTTLAAVCNTLWACALEHCASGCSRRRPGVAGEIALQ